MFAVYDGTIFVELLAVSIFAMISGLILNIIIKTLSCDYSKNRAFYETLHYLNVLVISTAIIIIAGIVIVAVAFFARVI
jgi:hypothetical protein